MVRRRQHQVERPGLPERLARFEPAEWPQEGLLDALAAWERERRDYVKAQDWLHTDTSLWIEAVAGVYRERRRVMSGQVG